MTGDRMLMDVYVLWQLTALLITILSFTVFYIYIRRYRESLSI